MKVLSTSDPVRPGNSAGIAFVLNKEITNTADATMRTLIPGRAAVLSLKWHNNETINILNIYAPNNASEHKNFWETIQTKWSDQHAGTIDFMMGDFNITEEPIDRAPTRYDNETAIEALRDLRSALNIHDLWRIENPHQRMFTFNSNRNTLSRLDRIYTSERHSESMLNWDSQISPIPTDHHIVSVRFAPPGLPHIGKGRWSWPIGIMTDETLIKRIIKLGIEHQERIEGINERNDTSNPQQTWSELKQKITCAAKEVMKTHLGKINQRIRTLTKDLRKTTNSNTIDTSEDTRINRSIIEQEISHLQKKRNKKEQLKAQAQWASQGEKINKYWSKINSQKTPRDIIHRLHVPGTNRYATKSEEMAEVARNYHENIQSADNTQHNDIEQQTARRVALAEIPEDQKIAAQTTQLNEILQEEHVLNALMSSKSGSATGIDGIPYELWKHLHDRYKDANKKKKPGFNLIKTLTKVMNDIQLHGVNKDSDFTLGWMCPLYKKKDRTKIENYRPITLLNTDYKILTKALAI
jgi:hypothetical protein